MKAPLAMDSAARRYIVMLGTSARTLGGIAAAIRGYHDAGLFARWPILHLATHCDGGASAKLAQAAAALSRFTVLLVRRQVLAVHVHAASNASFWRKSMFIALALAARRPVIFHLHGGGFLDFYHRCGPRRRRFVRFVLDRSSQIIVLSDTWRLRLSDITGNPNIRAIANPVEARDLLALDPRRRGRPVALFMGRLDRDKGIFDLVDAAAALARTFPELRVRFAGDGDGEGIRRRAAEQGVAHAIELTGWIRGPEKTRVWADAAIYVLPSYIENLPMGVLEAMAAGLPVVASRVGGIPDLVVSGVNGYLIAPGDTAALTAVLQQLLSDPGLRRRFAEASRRRFLERFSPARVVPEIEAVYSRLGAAPQTVADTVPACAPERLAVRDD